MVGTYARAPGTTPGVTWAPLDVRDGAAVRAVVGRCGRWRSSTPHPRTGTGRSPPTGAASVARGRRRSARGWCTCRRTRCTPAGLRLCGRRAAERRFPLRRREGGGRDRGRGARPRARRSCARSLIVGDAPATGRVCAATRSPGRATLFEDEIRCPVAVDDLRRGRAGAGGTAIRARPARRRARLRPAPPALRPVLVPPVGWRLADRRRRVVERRRAGGGEPGRAGPPRGGALRPRRVARSAPGRPPRPGWSARAGRPRRVPGVRPAQDPPPAGGRDLPCYRLLCIGLVQSEVCTVIVHTWKAHVRLDSAQIRVLAHPLRARLLGELRLRRPGDRHRTWPGARHQHRRHQLPPAAARRGRAWSPRTRAPAAAGERWWRAAHDVTSWSATDFDGDPDADAAVRLADRVRAPRIRRAGRGWNARSRDDPPSGGTRPNSPTTSSTLDAGAAQGR